MQRVYLTYLGNSMELPDGETIVGRSLSCRMRFNDSAVSRQHLVIQVAGSEVLAEDMGSRNGTMLNGKPMVGRRRLGSGDELMVGNRRMQVVIASSDSGFDEVPTDTISEMPNVAPPSLRELDRRVEQRCPECKQPVSFEDDLCDHCGYSWADFRPLSVTKPVRTMGSSPPGRERRRHQRHKVEVPILYNSENLTLESMALDLSRSGVFVRTQILDEVGTHCTLTLMVDGGPALTFHGRVCRVVDSPHDGPLGLGIEFCDMTQNARRWLDDTIARVGSPMPG